MAQYLIRPDGHIGYRCGGTDLDGLQHYLAHWLPKSHTTSSLNNQLQRTIHANSTAHHSTDQDTDSAPRHNG